MSNTSDWEHLINDVNERILTMWACWEATAKDNPDLHERLVRDIYVPAVRLLAEFCASIEIASEP